MYTLLWIILDRNMNDKAISQTKYVNIFDEYQILSCNVGAIFESYKNVNAHTIGYGGTSAYTFHYIIKAVVYTKSIYISNKGLL